MDFRRGMTIAIINWNHELVLPRAVSSALKAVAVLRSQGISGEVLVSDYCSRDGSVKLLRQLESLYYGDGLRFWSFSKNENLATGRNRSIELARHRYLCFLDSDNELIPENLPIFLQSLEETKASVVYGNLLVREGIGRSAKSMVSNESIQTKIFSNNFVDAFAVIDRLQFVDAGGYNSSWQCLEDHECWLHLITNGHRIVFVPAVLGYYYSLAGSMSLDDPSANLANNRRLQRAFNQFRARGQVRNNTNCLRYHPALGYH